MTPWFKVRYRLGTETNETRITMSKTLALSNANAARRDREVSTIMLLQSTDCGTTWTVAKLFR